MPTIDPAVRFWISFVITVAIGISSGTMVIKGAFPETWVPYITVWAGIVAFLGSAIQTTLSGAGMTTNNRIASAASVDGVKGITVDPKIASVATEAAGANAKVTTTSPVGRAA